MPGSIATPALLAAIIIAKYQQGTPLYRLEKYFRGKAQISRQTMSNWIIGAAKALKPLDDLLLADIRAGPVQRHDETRVQVVTSPQSAADKRGQMRQAWIWVALGGEGGRRAVRFKYADTRAHETVVEYLEGFKGYFQTDGCKAYDCALRGYPDVRHGGCFAHARRKFVEAEKNGAEQKGAAIALHYIRELYAIESDLRGKLEGKNITAGEFLEEREARAGVVLRAFRKWLDKRLLGTNTESLLGKAIGYASNQWQKLIAYLDCVYLTPDNNLSENAIRPFVIGRKNWLFFQCEAGADSASLLYSLIETAKLNGVEPLAYLTRVIELAPTTSDWASLLPWNLKLPDGSI
jgi:transposase